MDLIPEEQRDPVFRQRERELMRLAQPLGLDVTCFKTSIWDETLYRAWSMMVHTPVPHPHPHPHPHPNPHPNPNP